MLTMFLAAVDGTIVATALPAITAELSGFTLYPWVASIYLLVSAATVPIYGRLSDIHGRRRLLFLGIGLFLLGSTLAGLARTMEELVLFRALQGLGAGALLPLSQTVVGDIYTREERARMQGYFSSVWGVSAILGPLLGALFVETLSWRWVFYVNLPVGLLAAALLALYFREEPRPESHRVDWLGAFLLTLGVAALMLGLQEGRAQGWAEPGPAGLLLLALTLLAAFAWQELTFPEPLLPAELFRNRVILFSNLGGLLAGGVMAVTSFALPIFVTGVLGESVGLAGAAIAPVSIGWPLASTLCGRIGLRTGFRATALFGGALSAAGAIWFLFIGTATGYAYLAAGSFLIGLGLGFTTTGFLIEVQNAVPWHMRGIATASQGFVRQIGSTIGLGVMGAVLFSRTVAALQVRHPDAFLALHGGQGALDAVNRLLDPLGRQSLPAGLGPALADALTDGVHAVYWVTLVAAVGVLAAVVHLPAGPQRVAVPAAGGGQAGGEGGGAS